MRQKDVPMKPYLDNVKHRDSEMWKCKTLPLNLNIEFDDDFITQSIVEFIPLS